MMFFDDLDDLFYPRTRRQFSAPTQRFEAPYYYYPKTVKHRPEFRNGDFNGHYPPQNGYCDEDEDGRSNGYYVPGYPYPTQKHVSAIRNMRDSHSKRLFPPPPPPQQTQQSPRRNGNGNGSANGNGTRPSDEFFSRSHPPAAAAAAVSAPPSAPHRHQPEEDDNDNNSESGEDAYQNNFHTEHLNIPNRRTTIPINGAQKHPHTSSQTQPQPQSRSQSQPKLQQQSQVTIRDVEKYVKRIQAHIRRWLIQTRGLLDKLRSVENINKSLHSITQKYNTTLNLISQFDSDKLNKLKAEAECSTFDLNLIPNKKERQKILAYEDELMRLLLSLDNIVVGGVELVREKRKRLVKDIQRLLDHIDKLKLICKQIEEIETIALSHNKSNTENSPQTQNNSTNINPTNQTNDTTPHNPENEKQNEKGNDSKNPQEFQTKVQGNFNEFPSIPPHSTSVMPQPITKQEDTKSQFENRTVPSPHSPQRGLQHEENCVPPLKDLCKRLIKNALRFYANNCKQL